MVQSELLEILRCPYCVSGETRRTDKDDPGLLDLQRDYWLVCTDCARKYPIVSDIPKMLIEEGEKWKNILVESLPTPPPESD